MQCTKIIFQLEYPFLMSIKFISFNTIETKIAETQDSGSVCDNCDFEIVARILLKNLVNVTLVLQTDMKTFRIDINMRKSLTSFTNNRLKVSKPEVKVQIQY